MVRCYHHVTYLLHSYIHPSLSQIRLSLSDLEASKLLMLFSVEHTNALDRAVVGNQLAGPPSTGRSNRLRQEGRRKPRFAAPGGTPSGTVCLGLS
jgi:hypothetical protein